MARNTGRPWGCARRRFLCDFLAAWLGMATLAWTAPALTEKPAASALAAPPSVMRLPAPAPAGGAPCRDQLLALPTGAANPDPYLAAVACLRKADSASGSMRLPFERSLASRSRAARSSDTLLRTRLPADRTWLLTHLDRARIRHDVFRGRNLSWLAESFLIAGPPALPGSGAKGPTDAEVWRELSAVYTSQQDAFHACLALLRLAELDSLQSGFIQYQLENTLRTAGGEEPTSGLLDSLSAVYVHTTARTAGMLETLCWSQRHYPGAFRNWIAQAALGNPGPSAALERVTRFQSLGYFDFASDILKRMGWRKLGQPWLGLARSATLQIRFQQQDWPGLLSEASGNPDSAGQAGTVTGALPRPALGPEGEFFVATALLKLGRPKECLERIQGLESRSEPPWGFRARLLKAQAQMGLGQARDAAKTLDALKRDPRRLEATGPILFWQACLALDQSRFRQADSLLVLASAYTGGEEAQRALDYRFFLLLDTTPAARAPFFRGLPEAPRSSLERRKFLEQVPAASAFWPFAQLEKAQIHLQDGEPDSAEAVFGQVAAKSPSRLAGYAAEARSAFILEKLPGGRQAALARYEDLLIKYQQGVVPEFSRGRIRALR